MKIAYGLLVALGLASTTPANALPTQLVYDITMPNGPDPSNASEIGIMIFALDADVCGACRYFAEWNSNFDEHALSTNCYLNEAKVHGAASCLRNSTRSFPTLITVDPALGCSGFDGGGQPQSIFLIVAGENGPSGDFSGLIQYSPAAPFLMSFAGVPFP